MSKTDKTRPWWVRATERPLHTCVPVHRHEDGVCDLPQDPAERWGERWGSGSCFWTEGNGFFYGRDGGCGCAMCTGQVWRRAERRADRHAAARVCRDAVRAFASGDIDEFDDSVPRHRYW